MTPLLRFNNRADTVKRPFKTFEILYCPLCFNALQLIFKFSTYVGVLETTLEFSTLFSLVRSTLHSLFQVRHFSAINVSRRLSRLYRHLTHAMIWLKRQFLCGRFPNTDPMGSSTHHQRGGFIQFKIEFFYHLYSKIACT